MFYLPHFTGFTTKSTRFLRSLKRNNNREWFHAHKEEYEQFLKLPMQSLAQDLGDHFHFAPDINFDPKKAIFRINRDVRFSNDKSPYKTNIGAFFRLGLKSKFEDTPGLYVHFEDGEVFSAGGLYMPSARQIRLIRLSIQNDPESFLKIIEDKKFKRRFPLGIEGDNLKRAPSGTPIDHPLIKHLRHKQCYVHRDYTIKNAFQKSFVKKLEEDFEIMLPLIRWIYRSIND